MGGNMVMAGYLGSLRAELAAGVDARIEFFDVDGSGNTFLLMRSPLTERAPEIAADWARRICGDGGWDGVLWVCAGGPGNAGRMVVFNRDGSRPEACGNALRCVAQVLFAELGPGCDSIRIDTDAGVRTAWPGAGGQVRVSMGVARVLQEAVVLDVAGQRVEGTFLSMGNPHFVVAVDSVDEARVPEVGAALATHDHFPEGTNVEFLFGEPAGNSDGMRIRVWERGVGETAACGSGACAVAWVCDGKDLSHRERVLHLVGGELGVRLVGEELVLRGPALVRPVGS